MLIEPVPARPPGRRSRLLTALSVALPALALVTVVGLSFIDDDERPPGSEAPDAAAGSAAPAPTPGGTNPMIVGVADDRFPGWAVGLPVRSIEHAIAERESGRLEGQLVAVAGHLTLDPRGTECGEGSTAGPASVVCRRTGLLATSSDPVLGVVGDSDQRQVTWLGRPGPHLHPEFLPGTPLPGIIKAEVVNRRVPIEAVPAVVLGRFDDPRARPCLPGRRHCGFEFVVDRIIWSAGRWRERVVIHDPTIDVVPATTRQPATLLGGADLLGASLILTEALLSVETLSRVDPGVAGEIAGQATGPVWYLRGLVRETGHSPRTAVAWAVLDATTGAVLAVGDTTSSR